MQYTLVQYTAYISVHPKKNLKRLQPTRKLFSNFLLHFYKETQSDFDLFGFNQIGKMSVGAELKIIPFSVMH